MLYVNKPLKIGARDMAFGTLSGVAIGEKGRGRHELFLPTPKIVEGNIEGFVKNLSIGKSKTGKPRIDSVIEDDLYLILSSEWGYTRRGNGYITAPKDQEIELIARANGADGDAGRIGSWDAVIVKAKPGDIFRVTWAGSGYGKPSTLYVVTADNKVYWCDQPDVEELFDYLQLDIPFTVKFNGHDTVIMKNEWKQV